MVAEEARNNGTSIAFPSIHLYSLHALSALLPPEILMPPSSAVYSPTIPKPPKLYA